MPDDSLTQRLRNVWNSFGFSGQTLQNTNINPAIKPTSEIYKAVIPKFLYKPPFGFPRFVDIPELRRLAATPYVDMCTSTIIDEIAAVEHEIIPKDKTANQGHIDTVTEFFDNPNKNQESFEYLKRTLLRDILEIDSGVWVKVFDRAGRFKELYTRDGGTFTKNPDQFGIMPDENAYYQYGWITGARPVPFDLNEIVYLMRNPRPDSIYGRSPMEILMDVIQLLVYGIDSNLDYFTDNNIPKGVYQMINANRSEITAFKEQWAIMTKKKNEVGDWRKRWHHMPIVNSDGKYTRFSFSNTELELISQQQWFTKLVWACYGVTPSELGYTESSNRATEIVQSKVFRRKAIRPLLNLLQYHINTEIMPEFGFKDVKFQFNTYDLEEDLERHKLFVLQIKNGIKTHNEIREELGLDPHPDGDTLQKAGGFGFGQYPEQESDEEYERGMKAELKQKYVKRWRGRDGKWQYEYRETPKRKEGTQKEEVGKGLQQVEKKISELKKSKDKIDIEDAYAFELAVEEIQKGRYSDAKVTLDNLDTAARDTFLDEFTEKGTNEKAIAFAEKNLGVKFKKETKARGEGQGVGSARQGDGGAETCTCPKCGRKTTHQKGKPCNEIKCPKCGAKMTGKETKAFDTTSPLILRPFEEPYKPEKIEKAILFIIKEDKKKTLAALSAYMKESTIAQIKALDPEAIDRIKDITNFDPAEDIIKQTIRGAFYKGLEEAGEEIGMNFVPDQRAIDFLQKSAFEYITGMSTEIKNDIRGVLERGFVAGAGIDVMKEEIVKIFDKGETRAEAIARTETTRASNVAHQEGYEQADIPGEKQWISKMDNRTSDICRRLNEKTVKIGENFKDAKEDWEGPYPPAHVNCRSRIIFKPTKPKT